MYVKGGLSSFVNISHIFHNCATHAHSRSEMQAVTSQCLHMADCKGSKPQKLFYGNSLMRFHKCEIKGIYRSIDQNKTIGHINSQTHHHKLQKDVKSCI